MATAQDNITTNFIVPPTPKTIRRSNCYRHITSFCSVQQFEMTTCNPTTAPLHVSKMHTEAHMLFFSKMGLINN